MFLHSRFLPSLLKNSGLKHSRAADTLSGTHPPAGELQPLLLPLQVQWVENIPQFGCFGLRCWHSGCFLLGLPKGFAPRCLGVFVPCYTTASPEHRLGRVQACRNGLWIQKWISRPKALRGSRCISSCREEKKKKKVVSCPGQECKTTLNNLNCCF